jgi:hypothetical protein
MGCHLLSEEALLNPAVSQRKPRTSLLPLLVVLFVISYTLMVMLAIEQNSTITSQRWLIKQLLVDSTELSAMKGKAIQKHNADVQAEAQAQDRSKHQTQTPSTQAPTQESARTDNREKVRSGHPQHPPKPAADAADVRRALLAI